MATNPHFNNFFSTAEQSLHTNLIVEAIKMHGIDMFYLPRTAVGFDYLYAQDTLNKYITAHPCEFYIKNVEGFEGEGDFLSKFNLQIRDQTTFTVARTSFANNVATPTVEAAAVNIGGYGYAVGDLLFPVGGTGTLSTLTVDTVAAVFGNVSIVTAGTGFTSGDLLQVQGGTGTMAAIRVLDANANGEITSAELVFSALGSYTVAPTNPVDAFGITGTGATFNLDFSAAKTVSVVNGGLYLTKPPAPANTTTSGAGVFATVTLSYATSLTRPREGDLLFFPLNKKFFQIKFVEHESMFYPLGELKIFDLKCELWEHSGERIQTGVTEIDDAALVLDPAMSNFSILAEDGRVLTTEAGYPIVLEQYSEEQDGGANDSKELQTEASGILDFSEINPFSENIV